MSNLSRRDFIRLSTLGLGSGLLAACGVTAVPSTPPAGTATLTPAPLPTLAPTKEKKDSKGRTEQAAPTAANGDFIAMPLLGRPTRTSITANVVPAVAMNLYYEIGAQSGAYTAHTDTQPAVAGAPAETLIGELTPGTRYYYRLRYNEQSGPEQSFVTPRAPGQAFTFAMQGDSHPERLHKEFDADLYSITLRQAAADHPDFYMTLGDDFSVDSLKTVNAGTVQAPYANQRQWLGLVGAPIFLVNGNHEQASQANLDGTPNNVAVWAQAARNGYYPQPAPDAFYSGDEQAVQFIGPLRDYYAFPWGDALFVVLDQYWHSPVAVDNAFGADRSQKAKRDLWRVTIGDAQYQWLKKTLESSAARYKFVFSHHVLGTGRGGVELAHNYEWGDTQGLAAHRPGWHKTIHQLMADNGVTIYFQGHDHIFVRQELDGVIYQTLPEPADPNYALNNAESYLSGDKLPGSGYVRVNVASSGVKVEYVRCYLPQDETGGRRTGEVAYSYSV